MVQEFLQRAENAHDESEVHILGAGNQPAPSLITDECSDDDGDGMRSVMSSSSSDSDGDCNAMEATNQQSEQLLLLLGSMVPCSIKFC